MGRSAWFLGAILVALALRASGADLAEANRLLLKGNYDEALEQFEALAREKKAPGDQVALGQGRCLVARGKLDEADKVWEQAGARPELLAARAELALDRGRYPVAKSLADQAIAADANNLEARWVRAQLLSFAGEYEKAGPELEWFVQRYNEAQFTDAESLLWVARGAAEFARRNKLPDEFDFILNELLPDALESNADFWPAHWFAGTLLVEKYNKAEGVPELKKALAINPNATAAHVALGVAALQDFDIAEGKLRARRALEINPHSAEALRLEADLALADGRTADAIAPLEKARAINPVAEETLGRLAACYWLRNEPAKARALETEVKSRNPRPGTYYAVAAEALDQRRQYALAEPLFRQAIAVAPHLAGPRNGLGLLLMKIGKEDEARKVFAEARELDPFHVRVLNMTKVLKHLSDYTVVRSPHYEVWVYADKDRLLGQYISEFLESIHPTLCRRFGYEPAEPSKIEVMIDHSWFSARVVGLPSIGTVGACTGNVVALTSPRSLKTPFNWARVLTHEVTHILTLQQTRYNIPHWYTEALAVLSEGYPRPEEWNHLLAERVPKGDLYNLDNINHAFARPKTSLDWQMAYCQSLMYAQYMVERFGERALADLLAAYRDGLETGPAIERVFHVNQADFEKGYRAYLDKVVTSLPASRAPKKRTFADLERAALKDPKNAELQAELALIYLRRKDPAKARELAEQALALDRKQPLAAYVLARMELSIGKTAEARKMLEPCLDPKHPREEVLELLASIYLRQKDYAKAAELYELGRASDPLSKKWLEELVKVRLLAGKQDSLEPTLVELARMDSDNLLVRKKLAQIAAQNKRWGDAKRWAEEALHVDVADVDAHRWLGQAALETKNFSVAAREFEVLKSLRKGAAMDKELAQAYLGLGQKAKAKALLAEIMARNPADQDAASLLKQADAP